MSLSHIDLNCYGYSSCVIKMAEKRRLGCREKTCIYGNE